MAQSVNKKIGTLPAIKPKLDFCQIRRKMLGAQLMPRADYAALQEREGILYGVRMNIPLNVDSARMVDGAMLPAIAFRLSSK